MPYPPQSVISTIGRYFLLPNQPMSKQQQSSVLPVLYRSCICSCMCAYAACMATCLTWPSAVMICIYPVFQKESWRMATSALGRLDRIHCCRQGNRIFFSASRPVFIRWNGKKGDSISIREIELPLWISEFHFVSLSVIIDHCCDLIRFLPPFVGPEMPRCGPDQISAMYDLGFV